VCAFLPNDCVIECTSGDYRPGPFKLHTNSNRASTTNSTTNLSAPHALNSQDYEHVLSKLLDKDKKRQMGRKEEELGGSHDERTRGRPYEEGEGENESDISEGRKSPAWVWRRKEKARFHSLLSVVGWEGVQATKELEQNDDEDWDWDEWEEGRRKSLFDPGR
jgi:hypothetical protein